MFLRSGKKVGSGPQACTPHLQRRNPCAVTGQIYPLLYRMDYPLEQDITICHSILCGEAKPNLE